MNDEPLRPRDRDEERLLRGAMWRRRGDRLYYSIGAFVTVVLTLLYIAIKAYREYLIWNR